VGARVKLAWLAMLAACGHHDEPKAPANTAPTGPAIVETIDEAVAAKGKLARVRGTAQREKLGDTIEIGALSILCVGATFPKDTIGKPIEAEGTLGVTDRYEARVGSNGEHSAGVEGSVWVLEHCAPK